MAGATEVVPEVLEGSLMLATQAMTLLGVPAARAMERVQAVRERRYALLREYYRGETDAQTIAGRPAREIRSVHVEPGAAVCGIALGRLGMARHDVRIDALVRAHIRIDEPDEDLLVEGGDVLVLSGAPAGLHAAERDLLGVRGGRAKAAAGD
jgi:CPA2 family monovalent cation:H+ antiporter-2